MDPIKLKDVPPWEWPDDTGKNLLRWLRDDGAKESDRVLAASLAGNLVVLDDEIAGVLLALVGNSDASEKLRSAAAIALGPALESADELAPGAFESEDFDDDEPISEEVFVAIKDRFHELFLDDSVPKNVRRNILEASVRAPAVWHADALRRAYTSEDPAWRLTAVFCMGYVRGFDEQILESLASENPGVHYHAVIAASNWSLDEAWPHIERLIQADDTDEELLVAAIEAAVNIRAGEAKELLEPLLDSPNEEIVEVTVEALGMCDVLLEAEEFDDEFDDGFDDEPDDELD